MVKDGETSSSGPSVNRRAFAMTSLATGFALSVQPISAATITTPTETVIRVTRATRGVQLTSLSPSVSSDR